MHPKKTKIVIIGGGAAGFFAAANLSDKLGKSAIIIEKSDKLLSKVKVSGGGRCNVSHACFKNSALLQHYPRGQSFLPEAFKQFGPTETIEWFEQRGVNLKTESDGRIFPMSDKSQSIIDCLMHETARKGIQVLTKQEAVHIEKKDKDFLIRLKDDTEILCEKILIASGGSAKDSHYAWLKSLGHQIVKPIPSLFTFNLPKHGITDLMGVSVPSAKVRISGSKLESEGALLITHWGFSGPAILKLSAFGAVLLHEKEYRFPFTINWLPQYNDETLRTYIAALRNDFGARTIGAHAISGIPKRLWEYFLMKAEILPQTRWAEVSKKNMNVLINCMVHDEYVADGKTTFKEEFVTCGGVDTSEINPQTMESKICPNLYFAGEVINVDGVTGGFNFQAAWTEGWIAAKGLSA